MLGSIAYDFPCTHADLVPDEVFSFLLSLVPEEEAP